MSLTFIFFLYRGDFLAGGNVQSTGRHRDFVTASNSDPRSSNLGFNKALNQKEEKQDSAQRMALLSASSHRKIRPGANEDSARGEEKMLVSEVGVKISRAVRSRGWPLN